MVFFWKDTKSGVIGGPGSLAVGSSSSFFAMFGVFELGILYWEFLACVSEMGDALACSVDWYAARRICMESSCGVKFDCASERASTVLFAYGDPCQSVYPTTYDINTSSYGTYVSCTALTSKHRIPGLPL
jgi:hypothetical protein